MIRAFRYANKLLPTETMVQQYYANAYPHLISNITIWGTASTTPMYIRPLIRTQKRIIRLIANTTPRAHTKPIMNKLQILPITDLYTLQTCAEMHPHIYKTELNRPTNIHKYTPATHIHEHNTRYASDGKHYIPAHQHHYHTASPEKASKHQMTHDYSKTWNKIPQEIRQIQSLPAFKRALKLHLLNKNLTI